MSNVDERRQRAREAAYDSEPDDKTMHYDQASIDAAVKVATRVKITDEVMHVYRVAAMSSGANAALKAALEELGFEVEE